MLQPLHDAGVEFLNDLTVCKEADLVAWTGFPPTMVLILYKYAVVQVVKWDGLTAFGKVNQMMAICRRTRLLHIRCDDGFYSGLVFSFVSSPILQSYFP